MVRKRLLMLQTQARAEPVDSARSTSASNMINEIAPLDWQAAASARPARESEPISEVGTEASGGVRSAVLRIFSAIAVTCYLHLP